MIWRVKLSLAGSPSELCEREQVTPGFHLLNGISIYLFRFMKVLNVSVTYWKKNYKLKHFIKCKIVVLSLVSVVLSSKLKTIFSWASKKVWWEGCLLPSWRTWV